MISQARPVHHSPMTSKHSRLYYNPRITGVNKELSKIREDMVKRDVDMSRKLESRLMNPLHNGSKGSNDPLVSSEDPKKMREFVKRETEHIFEFI